MTKDYKMGGRFSLGPSFLGGTVSLSLCRIGQFGWTANLTRSSSSSSVEGGGLQGRLKHAHARLSRWEHRFFNTDRPPTLSLSLPRRSCVVLVLRNEMGLQQRRRRASSFTTRGTPTRAGLLSQDREGGIHTRSALS